MFIYAKARIGIPPQVNVIGTAMFVLAGAALIGGRPYAQLTRPLTQVGALLHHVRELVGDQCIADERAGPILAGVERDVLADGEGAQRARMTRNPHLTPHVRASARLVSQLVTGSFRRR